MQRLGCCLSWDTAVGTTDGLWLGCQRSTWLRLELVLHKVELKMTEINYDACLALFLLLIIIVFFLQRR